ncbi:MAG TPA: alkaline phosphatase D family protein [Thermoanaerobaculales bacterium]|nr:alkaline phosphatase D family protein [Thermoanaerobaculales bacterium]HQL29160.1 alkaline phosphatase D family protein [Thermoanaerobaculales bacterium]
MMLQRVKWLACALVMVGCLWVAAIASADMFPQSVASGDPHPDSVVLWTRLASPEMPDALRVEVATDEEFQSIVATRDLVALEQYDWVVKARIEGLQPYTTYYYRFVYGSGAAMEVSPVGRTKTAPSPDMDVPVRFAVVYCQDYIGRYYNAYLKLLRDHDEDIDFVVHLGDLIYETTGDPEFQTPDPERRIDFEDLEGAIALGGPDDPYYAAASLSNYRDIYRTYRSDPVYQQVHERWPMIVIWDDHEYSDDAWGATSTYFAGRVDEYNEARKLNAEQAFFEWAPTEIGLGDDGTLEIDASVLWPNTRIYRDYLFGRNLHLVLTDYRTYRPDHIVPEDAFPGTIAVDEPALIELLTEPVWQAVRGSFDPYVDMDVLGAAFPILRQTATLAAAGGYMQADPTLNISAAIGIAEQALSGNVSTTVLNSLFAGLGIAEVFTPEVTATLPRGISYAYVGKTGLYSSIGSRNQYLWDTFNLLAAHRYLSTGGAAQEALGGAQTAWLQGTMLQSPATWKVLGSSVMLTPLLVDFTHPAIEPMLPDDFPPYLRTRIGITADDWDGFPQKKLEILGLLGVVPNSVVISGDIHAAFVTDHKNGVYEFTSAAISSATIGDEVARRIGEILPPSPERDLLLQYLATLLQVSTIGDPYTTSDIVYANTWAHGFSVLEAGPEALLVTLYEIPSSEIFTSYYDDPEALDGLFQTVTFRVQDGELIPGG